MFQNFYDNTDVNDKNIKAFAQWIGKEATKRHPTKEFEEEEDNKKQIGIPRDMLYSIKAALI